MKGFKPPNFPLFRYRAMWGEEYVAAIAALNLNQSQAAHFFRITERRSRQYAIGAFPVPFAIATLLRLMLARGINPGTVERLNAVSIPKASTLTIYTQSHLAE